MGSGGRRGLVVLIEDAAGPAALPDSLGL